MIANRFLRSTVFVLAMLPFVAQPAHAQSRRGGGSGARPAGGQGAVRQGQIYTGGRHAVPRPPYRGHRYYGQGRHYYGYPAYPYYGYAPFYGYGYPGYGYPGFGFSVGFGYGGFGWGVGFGYAYPSGYGYGYPAYYGYAPAVTYAPVVVPIAGRPYGGVRLAIPERHASVTVDGYLVGSVDDFDGTLQQLNLERGTHRIEIAAPGFESAQFDVNIRDGQTITYRSPLRRIQ